MGLIITKYETTTDIVFDTSKFDYSYDDDPFPTDSQTDFSDIIDETGGTFSVIRQTTTTDGMGTVSDVSEASFSITGYLMDIDKKDRQVHDMGLATPGHRILYVKPVYNSSDIVKEEEVLIDRNSYKWRLIKILQEPYFNATQIYKKCVVQSIGLEGST